MGAKFAILISHTHPGVETRILLRVQTRIPNSNNPRVVVVIWIASPNQTKQPALMFVRHNITQSSNMPSGIKQSRELHWSESSHSPPQKSRSYIAINSINTREPEKANAVYTNTWVRPYRIIEQAKYMLMRCQKGRLSEVKKRARVSSLSGGHGVLACVA